MKKLSLSIACLAWVACTPDIPQTPSPNVIVARFDPSAKPPVVPSPNDLATNPETGKLAVPISDTASDADKEFYAYLNTLNGFPTSAGASTTFTGKLDATTVNKDTVKVFDVTQQHAAVTPAAIVYSDTMDTAVPGRVDVAPPPGGWIAGHTYAVAIISGSNGVKGGNGFAVVASPTWAFLRNKESLLACENEDAGTGCISATELIPSDVKGDAAGRLADQTAKARQLEQLRLRYKPTLDVLEKAGTPRSQVALLWTFKTNSYTLMQFNPAAVPSPQVPTPNDLAIDRTTGLVNAPIDPASPPAQQEFTRDYLNTLNGFPASATGSAIVVGGELDPASIVAEGTPADGGSSVDNVFVVDLTTGRQVGGIAASYDAPSRALAIAPPGGSWGKFKKLALAIVGGAGGVRDSRGDAIVGSETWALARSEAPLVTCEDLTAPDCQPAITAAPLSTSQAIALEGLRRGYKPVIDRVGAVVRTATRPDLALLWVFSTVSQPEATFDPAASIIPFPNNLLINPATGKLALPLPAGAPALLAQLIGGLNTLDGFSLTAAAVSENSDTRGALDVDSIDPLALDGGTTGFGKLPLADGGFPGRLTPRVRVCLDCVSSKLEDGGSAAFFPDGGAPPQQLQFVPQLPLEEQTHYAGWVTTALTDTRGRKVSAAPAFALLRSSSSLLTADGGSAVVGVSVADATALEPARQGLKPMFEALAALGHPRKELALAFSYRTQTTVTALQGLNAFPSNPALPSSIFQPSSVNEIKALLAPSVQAILPAVAKVYQAEITLPFLLTGPGDTLNPAMPKFRTAPVLITIPTGTAPAAGWPVLVFGHGLNGNRTQALGYANTAATAGLALVAIDVVLHGERTSCVGAGGVLMQPSDDAACANPTIQTCSAATGRCVARASFTPATCTYGSDALNDGNFLCLNFPGGSQGLCLPSGSCEGGDFARNASGQPLISAWNFLNLSNLFATRDNFRYAPLDFAQLIKILKVPASDSLSLAARMAAQDASSVLDPSNINYAGQSLGGFNGAMASAVNADFKNIGLNVPGSDQVQALLTAPGFQTQRTAFLGQLAALGLRPGVPAFDQFIVLAKTILDPADPQNAIWSGVNSSTPAARKLYLQYIENDLVIPNPTTLQLINAANQGSKQAQVTFFQPAATFPFASRHGFLLACPGDSTGMPEAACAAARAGAQSKLAAFLVTGTAP